ncbi:tyrosine-protein phosphatase [Actinomadura hibisca]|uniref:tyrosine-protein phosphatase n=1 Tax=Actinomadura hibisca TaxID=68565 RepID=UPI0008310071|nr:tyrosine-protein phosphatase [Actinomadura hibisca]
MRARSAHATRAAGVALAAVLATGVAVPAHAAAPVAHPRVPAPSQPADRFQGTANFRDVGGLRTWWGARVRSGVIYRSDALNKLTDADRTALAKLGVRRIVDFRTPTEVGGDGPDQLPSGLAVTARPIDDTGMYVTVNGAIGSKDPVRQQQVLGGDRGAALLHGVYRSFVTDARSRAAFGATLREMAGRRTTPLVFHCTSGKDRTGWTTYLLLRVLGVDHRTAERDYLLSNAYRAETDAKVREQLKAAGYMQDPQLLAPVQEVRTDYLDAALNQARRSYGSLDRYLRVGLGVDGRTAAELRHRLTTR